MIWLKFFILSSDIYASVRNEGICQVHFSMGSRIFEVTHLSKILLPILDRTRQIPSFPTLGHMSEESIKFF